MPETENLTPDLVGALPGDTPFNRDVDALLLDIAHRPTLSGAQFEKFWADLRGLIGNRASNYRLETGINRETNNRYAMLVPKQPAV
ncbi:MAG: hypothetical protein HYS86_03710 [Candidatus Chisholmbacteria bacterium]|nr:hypothetical protein [Candidatus Chisholmbacteria bacterium]